jgi:GNAT superfamily N-acetyltransferase
MNIRDSMPDDAAAIAELNSAAWRVAFRGIVTDDFLSTHDGAPLGRREVLENLPTNSIQLVADNDGDVVGWLAAHPCEDADCDPSQTVEVGACYVTPTFWRRGVGRLMMSVLFERLATSHWIDVKVWTARDTPASHAFYRSLGFKEDGRAKDHTIDDNNRVPVIRFSYNLADDENRER